MQQEPVAASAFAAGSLVSWEQDTVVLGYAQDSFELGWARDAKKLEDFAGACSQQAGRRLSVQIREIRPDEQQSPQVMQASAFQEQARKQADRARSLREEAQGHPITRALVDGFGATINSITTEADES